MRFHRSGSYARWIVPTIIALVVIWVARILSNHPPSAAPSAPAVTAGRVVAPTPSPTPDLTTVGPNLLSDPSFALGGARWVEYHNAAPMEVTFLKAAKAMAIRLNGVSGGVQEVYQFVRTPTSRPVVVSGVIQISGSPLPTDSNAQVSIVDMSGAPHLAVIYGSISGKVGTYPFASVVVPNGGLKQVVLTVITGSVTNSSTVVTFGSLKVALQEDQK